MSAILGRIHLSGQAVDPQEFGRALAALGEYGREEASAWTDGAVALGHQHLAISPESYYEAQPLVQDGLAIVADAILDNRDELCTQLDIDHHLRSELPDSQLILHAYRHWGERCVSHLCGDFAFAIWDTCNHELFCARDHIGARPLYLYQDQQRLLFATDIRALLAFEDIHPALDESRVACFLVWPLSPDNHSFFHGIQPIAAGHYLRIRPGCFKQVAYWQPLDAPSVRYSNQDDYSEHLRELLEKAVTCRLRTSGAVGSHLSGGLDSSGMTILANRQLHLQGRRLDRCYTWSPPVSERYPLPSNRRDERQVIANICRQEGLICHYGTATGGDYRDFLSRDITLEGTTDLYEELSVMAHAGQRDTRVMLSGWGGDESVTFNARGYAAYVLKYGQWLRLMNMARYAAGGCRYPGRMLVYLWQKAMLPLMPDAFYDRFSPYLDTSRLDHFIHPDLIARFPAVMDYRMLAWRDVPDPIQVQAMLLQNGHLGSRMATWAHWSAPHGLIYRYPLTDIRLLRFMLGLPPDLLWQRGRTRVLYQEALKELLPTSLSKQDMTNEEKRLDVRMKCWDILAAEAKNGRFHQRCAWLDTHAMMARITRVPQQVAIENSKAFFPLHVALRVWHLWEKHEFYHAEQCAA